MAVEKVYVGDIGTKLKLDAGTDISDAIVVTIKYRKPSGITGTWSATVEDDNYGSYNTVEGDLDESGEWWLQLYVETPSWKGHGDKTRMFVCNPIEV